MIFFISSSHNVNSLARFFYTHPFYFEHQLPSGGCTSYPTLLNPTKSSLAMPLLPFPHHSRLLDLELLAQLSRNLARRRLYIFGHPVAFHHRVEKGPSPAIILVSIPDHRPARKNLKAASTFPHLQQFEFEFTAYFKNTIVLQMHVHIFIPSNSLY